MKCINKIRRRMAFVCLLIFVTISMAGCAEEEIPPSYASIYEKTQYSSDLFRGDLFAQDLCVSSQDISLDGFVGDSALHAAGLFDISNQQVLYADRIHERLFPASTTKVLTAYIALKYGNPDDIVTVSEQATQFEPEASLCGLGAGDQITLRDLICGLFLVSGNDAGVAIAEHLSGSVEAFAQKMNEEAWAIGATNSHFVNPHGLHDENHYTTAYDLYLIFNEAVKLPSFLELVSMRSYTGRITGADGAVRNTEWTPTNFYSAGITPEPEGVRVLGGKTGTTDQAGNCVILYNQDLENHPYISVIMGAPDKDILYDNMSQLLTAGITQS